MSLTRAQPGPGCYVPCAVDIGVHAAVHGADRASLPRAHAFLAALVAGDAGVPGVHEYDSPLSFCRFSGDLNWQTTDVENFPGFPDGILGPELMDSLRKQRRSVSARKFATNAGESFGRVLANRCTWSGITSHATIRHSCSAALASISSRNRTATGPVSTCLRYLGHQATCRPMSYTPAAETCTSRAIRLVYQQHLSNRGRERGIPLPPQDGSPSARF